MNPELTEEQLINYLYGECPLEEKQTIEAHPETREKLADLSKVSHTLQAWPDEDPHLNLVFVQERESFWKALIPTWLTERPRNRWATGLSVSLAAALLLVSFIQFQMSAWFKLG